MTSCSSTLHTLISGWGNICIADSDIAKLIDLDRSDRADLLFMDSKVASLYTNSIMYEVRGKDGTLIKLDWWQLGIMIFFIPKQHPF